MSTPTPSGLPLTRPQIRRIAIEHFDERPNWKSSELWAAILQSHRNNGGDISSGQEHTFKRVLQELKADGTIELVGHGWWRRTDGEGFNESREDDPIGDVIVVDGAPQQGIPDEADEFLTSGLEIERELGDGAEAVYLYFNPNDRELAQLKGRPVWECKIGRTGGRDVAARVLGQGVKTSLSHVPVIGLVLRTDDSSSLERALHTSLRLVAAEVPDSLGVEWCGSP